MTVVNLGKHELSVYRSIRHLQHTVFRITHPIMVTSATAVKAMKKLTLPFKEQVRYYEVQKYLSTR